MLNSSDHYLVKTNIALTYKTQLEQRNECTETIKFSNKKYESDKWLPWKTRSDTEWYQTKQNHSK